MGPFSLAAPETAGFEGRSAVVGSATRSTVAVCQR